MEDKVPEYIGQHDRFSCGPVAIFNAIRWSGLGCIVREYLNIISVRCYCTPPKGTLHVNFDRALRFFSKGRFRVKRRIYPDIDSIEEHLRRPDGAVIINDLRIINNKDKGHYYLITEVSNSGRTFTGINIFKTVISATFRRTTLEHRFEAQRSKDGEVYPTAWFLTISRSKDE